MKKWKIKDREYQLHSQKCRDCVAAGQKPNILKRCDVGSLLWDSYKEYFESESPKKENQSSGVERKLKKQTNISHTFNDNSFKECASQNTPRDKKTMNLF